MSDVHVYVDEDDKVVNNVGEMLRSKVKEKGEGGSARPTWLKQYSSKLLDGAWRSFRSKSLDKLDELALENRASVAGVCLFVLANYLQLIGIISSQDLIAFPPEWLEVFGWLSIASLLDITVVFDINTETGRMLKTVFSTLLPLAIIGIIQLLLLKKVIRERLILSVSLFSLALSITFYVLPGSSADEANVFIFLGSVFAFLPIYWILRFLVVTRTNQKLRKIKDEETVDSDQIAVEVYLWLFLLVTVYAQVVRSALSFIPFLEMPSAIVGIILPLFAGMVLLLYVFVRARRVKNNYNSPGKFLVLPFQFRFWYFQIVLMIDKTVHLLLNLISDQIVGASISLAYIVITVLIFWYLKPFDQGQALPDSNVPGLKHITIGNLDLLGRVSNAMIVFLVLLFNVVLADAAKLPLSIIIILVSGVTIVFWVYILFWRLEGYKTLLAKYQLLSFKVAFITAGDNENLVAKILSRRAGAPFSRAEVESITDISCILILSCGLASPDMFRSLRQFKPEAIEKAKKLAFLDSRFSWNEDTIEYILEYLQQSNTVTELNLGGGSLQVQELKGGVETIDLRSNDLKDIDALVIGYLVKANEGLTNLSLNWNNFGLGATRSLTDALRESTSLVSVNLTIVEIPTENLGLLAEALGENKTIVNFSMGRAVLKVQELKGSTKNLHLNTNALTDRDTAVIVYLLNYNSTSTELILSCNNWSNLRRASIRHLLNSLRENKTLRVLNLAVSEFTDLDVPALGILADLVQENTTLKTINLGGPPLKIQELKGSAQYVDLNSKELTDIDAVVIGHLIKSNDRSTDLVLSWNNFGFDATRSLMNGLAGNTVFTDLKILGSTIDDETVKALGVALQANNSIANVSLGGGPSLKVQEIKGSIPFVDFDIKGFTDMEIVLVGQLIKWTELNLAQKEIGNEDAMSLAYALRENITVTTLKLYQNNIGPDGANALAEVLKLNDTITHLNLSVNAFGTDGAIHLAGALKVNTTTSSLYLYKCNIGPEGANALAEALKLNETLTILDLHENQIGTAGAAFLAEGLRTNGALLALNLDSTGIGDEGAVLLAQAFEFNTSLETLRVFQNKIGNAGRTALHPYMTRLGMEEFFNYRRQDLLWGWT